MLLMLNPVRCTRNQASLGLITSGFSSGFSGFSTVPRLRKILYPYSSKVCGFGLVKSGMEDVQAFVQHYLPGDPAAEELVASVKRRFEKREEGTSAPHGVGPLGRRYRKFR